MKKKIKAIMDKIPDPFIGMVTPHEIAAGFAIGTFISLLPTFGFSIILVTLFLLLFPKVNRPATVIALAFWNPILQVPIYTLSYEIGSMIFGDLPVVKYNIEILNQFFTLTRRLVVGNLITTSLLSVLSYLFVFVMTNNYLSRKKTIVESE